MTTKLNWGAKIALLYGGFVVLIAALVIGSMRQNFDLVSKDYYSDEIQYQHTIDASKNQAALSAPVRVKVQDDAIHINFPKEFEGKTVQAAIHLYAATDAKKDRTFSLNTETAVLTIPKSGIQPAYYTVKINWSSEGRNYYQESELNYNQR